MQPLTVADGVEIVIEPGRAGLTPEQVRAFVRGVMTAFAAVRGDPSGPDGHVAAMPDVHLGIGATIGSVIATHRAIIPAAVGVDIGCGMVAARLSITANDIDEKLLRKVFDQISRDVPVGRGQHPDDRVLAEVARPFEPGLKALTDRHPRLLKAFGRFSRWANPMGTPGGGNHFIEVCLDESDRVWAMLHSGSRGIGKAMADYFVKLARADMERWMIHLPDRDLAWHSGPFRAEPEIVRTHTNSCL